MTSAVLVLPTDPATARQREVIEAMAIERDVVLVLPDALTVAEASAHIDALKATPRAEREPVAAGFYVADSVMYRVRVSRAGNTYAERLNIGDGRRYPTEWKLAGGWQYRLKTTEAITRDVADELIALAFTPAWLRDNA